MRVLDVLVSFGVWYNVQNAKPCLFGNSVSAVSLTAKLIVHAQYDTCIQLVSLS